MKISCATHTAHEISLDAIWRTCVHSGIPFGWPWRSKGTTDNLGGLLNAHMCAKWRLMDFNERYVWHMKSLKGALGAHLNSMWRTKNLFECQWR